MGESAVATRSGEERARLGGASRVFSRRGAVRVYGGVVEVGVAANARGGGGALAVCATGARANPAPFRRKTLLVVCQGARADPAPL